MPDSEYPIIAPRLIHRSPTLVDMQSMVRLSAPEPVISRVSIIQPTPTIQPIRPHLESGVRGAGLHR